MDEDGVELPEVEEAAFRARLDGLLGEVRWRKADFGGAAEEDATAGLEDDLAERKGYFTLGRNGVAREDCESSDCVVGALLF